MPNTIAATPRRPISHQRSGSSSIVAVSCSSVEAIWAVPPGDLVVGAGYSTSPGAPEWIPVRHRDCLCSPARATEAWLRALYETPSSLDILLYFLYSTSYELAGP